MTRSSVAVLLFLNAQPRKIVRLELRVTHLPAMQHAEREYSFVFLYESSSFHDELPIQYFFYLFAMKPTGKTFDLSNLCAVDFDIVHGLLYEC